MLDSAAALRCCSSVALYPQAGVKVLVTAVCLVLVAAAVREAAARPVRQPQTRAAARDVDGRARGGARRRDPLAGRRPGRCRRDLDRRHIAQRLAADDPDVVDRLMLLATACRLPADGRALQRRVPARIRRGARRQALAVMMAALVPAGRGQLAAGALAWLIGSRVLTGGDDLADMATTIEVEDAFDLATCQSPIRAPTLILAGGADRFYGREL